MFSHLYRQKAILKVIGGRDCYGVPEIKEVRTIPCRIEFKNTIVIGQTGHEVSSCGQLFTDFDVKVGDIVTIENVDYTVEQACFSVGLDGEYSVNQVYFA